MTLFANAPCIWLRAKYKQINKLKRKIRNKKQQYWNIVNWTLGNKLQWNLNRDLYIFIQENAFENVVRKLAAILSRPQCVKYKPTTASYSRRCHTDEVSNKFTQAVYQNDTQRPFSVGMTFPVTDITEIANKSWMWFWILYIYTIDKNKKSGSKYRLHLQGIFM